MNPIIKGLILIGIGAVGGAVGCLIILVIISLFM